jgi:hypothetical protein
MRKSSLNGGGVFFFSYFSVKNHQKKRKENEK